MKKDWKKEFDDKFCKLRHDGYMELLNHHAPDIKAFIESLLKSKQEEIEKETVRAYEQGRNEKGSSFRLGYEAGRSEAVAEERERVMGVIEKLQNDGLNVIIQGDYYVNFRDLENILSSLDKPLTDKK